jgi:hypothetical protein
MRPNVRQLLICALAGTLCVDAGDVSGRAVESLGELVILGRVTDNSGYPVPGARIACRRQDGEVLSTRTSDEKGAFTVTGGCHSLAIDADGFAPITVAARSGDYVDASLVVGRLDDIGPGFVSGVVVDDSGRPQADASVWLSVVGGQREDGVRTDRAGRFQLASHAAGDLVVCARPAGGDRAAACVAVELRTYGERVKGLRLLARTRK